MHPIWSIQKSDNDGVLRSISSMFCFSNDVNLHFSASEQLLQKPQNHDKKKRQDSTAFPEERRRNSVYQVLSHGFTVINQSLLIPHAQTVKDNFERDHQKTVQAVIS